VPGTRSSCGVSTRRLPKTCSSCSAWCSKAIGTQRIWASGPKSTGSGGLGVTRGAPPHGNRRAETAGESESFGAPEIGAAFRSGYRESVRLLHQFGARYESDLLSVGRPALLAQLEAVRSGETYRAFLRKREGVAPASWSGPGPSPRPAVCGSAPLRARPTGRALKGSPRMSSW